jgi:cysteine desulfurase family protein (TIGR01976 family)
MNVRVWDSKLVRAQFPALALCDEGQARTYLDAPGGTQVCRRTLDRMREAMVDSCANDSGEFRTSLASTRLMMDAHRAAACLVGASSPDEIVFGLNSTSLLFRFSRLLSREWREGDEIILTRMDHDANVAPWLCAAEERGVTIRWLDFDPDSFRYRYEELDRLLGPRTKLVACNHASNLLGTVNDVKRIAARARAAGAISVVDGVQAAPHLPIDVQSIGCDIYACSPYKFFGPHAGCLFVRGDLLAELRPDKVRPCPDAMPWRYAPGTPSFEAQAGTLGCIEHIAWLGEAFGGATSEAPLREKLLAGWGASLAHEQGLTRVMLAGLMSIPGLRILGLTGANEISERVPTFSFTIPGVPVAEATARLAARNIFAWGGSFYAHEASLRLGLDMAGVIRAGLAHYSDADDVRRLVDTLAGLASRAPPGRPRG